MEIINRTHPYSDHIYNDTLVFEDAAASLFSLGEYHYFLVLVPVTMVGNGLTILAYVTDSKVRGVPFNFFIFNLAVADLLVGILTIPLRTFTEYLIKLDVIDINILYVFQWFVSFPLFMSALVVLQMTVDRLRMATNPIIYQVNVTVKANRKQTIVLWVVSIAYPTTIGVTVYIFIVIFNWTNKYDVGVFVSLVASMVFTFLLPVSVLLVLNTIFFIKVVHRMHSFNNQKFLIDQGKAVPDSVSSIPSSGSDLTSPPASSRTAGPSAKQMKHNRGATWYEHKNRIDRQLRKVALNLLLLVSIYLACWIPVHVIGTGAYFVSFDIPGIIVFTGYFLLYSNSAINPVIYATTNRRFRNAMVRLLSQKSY